MPRQDLDRHVAVELHVAREVDDPHPAAAKLTLEGVLAGEGRLQLEEFAGGRSHVGTYERGHMTFRQGHTETGFAPLFELGPFSAIRSGHDQGRRAGRQARWRA